MAILEPVVGCLDLARHVGELETNDRVFDKFLAKCPPFIGVFHRLFEADTRETDALDNDTDPFVIKICHDDCLAVSEIHWKVCWVDLPLKPWFSLPIKFPTGTLTSSNVI